MELSLEAYATVMAELLAAGDARGEALERHGLDEDRWETIDTFWQERLSEAIEPQEDGIPGLLAAYSAAYEAAQRALSPVISIEKFARVTKLLQSSLDIHAALAKVSVTFAEYVRSCEHWSRRIAEDPEVERRFEDALRGIDEAAISS
jgi:hypothetical protein